MGPCICIHGDNDSSILYFKNEKKKLLPSFPYDGDEYKLKTPEKKSNVDTNEDTKGKITPASLLFYQEESPILPKKEDNIRAPSFDQFHIRKVLGKGSFGKVLLVEQKFSGKLYAMKIIRKEDVEKRNQKVNTMTERKILGKFNCSFLVKLKYAFQNSDKLYMVMEFMRGGELFYHLKKLNNFNEAIARFYLAEIILGLDYLHKNQIIYRDLKPENLLLDEYGHIKLADFGTSKDGLPNGEKTYTFCGTPEYLAPEILLGQGHDKGVDWWSLGVLLYEMLTGTIPFDNKDRMTLYESILNKPLDIKPYFSVEATSILQALICVNPSKRLGSSNEDAEEIKKHVFFTNINWNWDLAINKNIPTPFKPELSGTTDLKCFNENITNQSAKDSPVYTKFGVRYDIYSNFTYNKKEMISSGSDFNNLEISYF